MICSGWTCLALPIAKIFISLCITAAALSCTSGHPVDTTDLSFSTYLGGNGRERVQALYVDASGFIYVGGDTLSTNLATPGAYDTTLKYKQKKKGFVGKLTPDGKRLIWLTLLGSDQRDDVYGIRVDSQGNVYVTGWTGEANIPGWSGESNFPTTPGAFQRTHGGEMDIFIAKISPDGSRLLYSTLIGGAGRDQTRGAMDIDADGNIYFSGSTTSLNYPTMPDAFQRAYKGGEGDAFVSKLSADGSALLLSTYLGSSGFDHAFSGLKVHSDRSIIVAGHAGAADFSTTVGSYSTTFKGGSSGGTWDGGDFFVARLTPDGSNLIFSTFLGGSGNEYGTAQHGLALDGDGNIVVFGATQSADFPTTDGAYQMSLNGLGDEFVAKLSLDGSTLIASTYFGGSEEGKTSSVTEASGVGVDSTGRIYVSGMTSIRDHPTTQDALLPKYAGGRSDAYFAVFSADLSTLIYSTFLGGSGFERARDLWITPNDGAVIGGDTDSSDFPTTSGVFQESHSANRDGYVTRFKQPRPPTN